MKTDRKPFDINAPRWLQYMLPLTREVIVENRRRLVCLPDRSTAIYELDKLQRQHGAALVDPNISKSGKGKTGTYTVSYTLKETRTEKLF